MEKYRFEGENARFQTVTTECYVAILRKFLVTMGRRRGLDRYLIEVYQGFQQDGIFNRGLTGIEV